MKWEDWLMSLSLHGAAIGTVTTAYFLSPSPSPTVPESDPIPIYFEIVEESALVANEQPGTVPEKVGTVPEDVGTVPEDMGTVPENMGTVPEDVGTVSEDVGTVSEDVGTVPEDVGTVPENMGTVPEDVGTVSDENMEKYKISDAKTGEIADKNNDVEHAKVVSDPVALNKIIPAYPRSARRRGHEGCVTVEILVAEDGHVSGAEIVSSSGHAELDTAALGAVRTAKFAPATEDGASVTGRLRLTFNFKLE